MRFFQKLLTAFLPFLKKKEAIPMPDEAAAFVPDTIEIMAPQEQVLPANADLRDVAHNRTLVALQLSAEAPATPELARGLYDMEAVFARFRPQAAVMLENGEGKQEPASFRFDALEDFSPQSLLRQSALLREQQAAGADCRELQKQLSGNKVLQQVLAQPDMRAAMIEALKSLLGELDD